MADQDQVSQTMGKFEEQQRDQDITWEIITTSLACITVGSLFIISLLEASDPFTKAVFVLLITPLMLAAPLLLVLSSCESFKYSKMTKWTLIIIRYPLYLGLLFELANYALKASNLLELAKLEGIQFIYILCICIFGCMAIIALIIGIERIIIFRCKKKKTTKGEGINSTGRSFKNSDSSLDTFFTLTVIAAVTAFLLYRVIKRRQLIK